MKLKKEEYSEPATWNEVKTIEDKISMPVTCPYCIKIMNDRGIVLE